MSRLKKHGLRKGRSLMLTEKPDIHGKERQEFLSAAELARLFGCSTRHVWRLHSSGKLPQAVRIGRLVRWPRRVVDDWISAGCPAQ